MKCSVILLVFLLPLLVKAQWSTVSVGTGNLYSIKFYGNNEIWIAGLNGLVKSTNNGFTWNTYPLIYSSGTPWIGSALKDIAISSSNTAVGAGFFYAGNEEQIVRTLDGGIHWDSVHWYPQTYQAEFFAADFPTPTTCYVAGWQGRVFKSSNTGQNWNLIYTNPSVKWQTMHFFSANEGVIGGDGGIIYTSNGSSFTQILSLSGGGISSISFKNNVGYAGGYVGGTGALYKSLNNGSAWTALNFPYGGIKSIATLSSDTVIVYTVNGQMFKTADGGIYWETMKLPQGISFLNSIRFKDSQNGYAVGYNGTCLKTTNAGGLTYPIASFTTTAPSSVCQYSTYTFANTSNPSYSFQWLVNGTPVSTSYNYNHTFNTGMPTIISLVAYNGNHYDTTGNYIYVVPEDFILQPTIGIDTICHGGFGNVIIYNSQYGVIYQMRKGFQNIGSAQTGNGGTLTFPVYINLPVPDNFKIWGSNSCFSDSLIENFIQPVFPNAYIPISTNDTLICASVEPITITINNSQSGVLYKLFYSSSVLDSAYGNNSTISLTAILPFSYPTNKLLKIQAFVNSSCKPYIKDLNISVDSVMISAYVNNPNIMPGDTITFTNTSNADTYLWLFPPEANIPSSTLKNPKLTINTPGSYPITMIAYNTEGCVDTMVHYVYVNAIASQSGVDFCGNQNYPNSQLFPLDVYTDQNNNTYATGTIYFPNDPGAGSHFDYRYFVFAADSSGNLKWYKEANSVYGGQTCMGNAVTTDQAGNAYTVGYQLGTNIYYGDLLFESWGNVMKKGFAIKYDLQGNEKWMITSVSNDTANIGSWMSDIAADNNGKIYITGGHRNATFTFPDSSTFTATGYGNSAFILIVDTAGNFIDYQSFGLTN